VETTVTEIHRWRGEALKPDGYVEPLWPTRESKRQVMEHLARSAPWLGRASDLLPLAEGGADGTRARLLEEPARLESAGGTGGRPRRLLRCEGRRSLDRRPVVGCVERWREVGAWWEPRGGVDRVLWRVELEGGAQVDLCRDRRTGSWSVVGLVD